MNHDHVTQIRASHDESEPSTSLKILGPGHLRSGHQVRSSDPTSEKLSNCVTATVVEIYLKLSGFGILLSANNLYISDFLYR